MLILFIPYPSALIPSLLAADLIADVFDGFADFAARRAETFLHVAGGAVDLAFGFEVAVARGFAQLVLHRAFSLIEFPFDLVVVQ